MKIVFVICRKKNFAKRSYRENIPSDVGFLKKDLGRLHGVITREKSTAPTNKIGRSQKTVKREHTKNFA